MPWQAVAAGFSAGIANLAVGHPFDTVKVRLQAEGVSGRFRGPVHCLSNTVRKEGFRALYKGASPQVLGKGVLNACLFGVYGSTASFLARREGVAVDQLSLPKVALSGLAAGWASAFIVTPVDQIKVCLQVQYSGKAVKGTPFYSGPLDCAMQLVRTEGPWGLFRGFGPTILEMSTMASYFAAYVAVDRCLTSYRCADWGAGEAKINASDRARGANDGSQKPKKSLLLTLFAGGVAGTVMVMLSYPFDLVKSRVMTQHQLHPTRAYSGVFQTLGSVVRAEGVKGLFRGMSPAMLRTFPTNAAAFCAFEVTMDILPVVDLPEA